MKVRYAILEQWRELSPEYTETITNFDYVRWSNGEPMIFTSKTGADRSAVSWDGNTQRSVDTIGGTVLSVIDYPIA